MKILALRLFNVKRFAGRGVAIEGFGDGVNVLCAVNEFGKSTSFEALHALFFQPYSGTPGAVRNLRPYSGGSPLVEADIAMAQGTFRLTKQYYGGRSACVTDLATGRLIAQADEAEHFIAQLIRGGTAGPAGLLWVRQGVTGLERRSASEEESEKQVRMSLLESVQGEVEAVTGGRRMAAIIDQVASELDQLVTKRGPKAGGRYAAILAECERLAELEHKLAGEVTQLRAALDQRASALKRLDELQRPEDQRQRQNAILAAQAALDAAKAQSETLKTAEAELKLAVDRQAGARRERIAFSAALAQAEALRETAQVAQARAQLAEQAQRDSRAAIETARQDLKATEDRQDAARARQLRLDAAIKARADALRRGELEQRLAAAQAARLALEENTALFEQVSIPSEAVDALDKLELEIARLEAVEEAARPSVTMDYAADAIGPACMEGADLIDGLERGYEDVAQITLPGLGRLTLRSNRPARGNNRLDQARTKRRDLLSTLGVSDLGVARARLMRAEQIRTMRLDLEHRLILHAPQGLDHLQAQVVALGAAIAPCEDVDADPDHLRAEVSDAEAAHRGAREALRALEPLHERTANAVIEARTLLAEVSAKQGQADQVLGPVEERARRLLHLEEVERDFDRALSAARAHESALRLAAVDLEGAQAALMRARSVDKSADEEIRALRETAAELGASIRARADEAVEEVWRETREALTAARARLEAFETEVRVLQRLASALDSARSQARDLYLKPVMAELRPLLGLLFDDVSITFDEKTLLPQTLLRNGQEEDVERLSGGMREQLSVLTRLAFARLLARDGRPAPVILDDALVYSDDDRIERMFDALHRQARDQQIIVFSCRQRAFQTLGGHRLAMRDWRP